MKRYRSASGGKLSEVDPQRRDDLLNQALTFATQRPDHTINLAWCLSELNQVGPLTEFIEQSRISRRKAYYLAEVGKRLNDLSAPDARLAKIGWTKLQIVARHVAQRPGSELLDLAEQHSVHTLKKVLSQPSAGDKTRCLTLYFQPGDYAKLETAILQFGAQRSGRGLNGKEEAILAMVEQLNGWKAEQE